MTDDIKLIYRKLAGPSHFEITQTDRLLSTVKTNDVSDMLKLSLA